MLAALSGCATQLPPEVEARARDASVAPLYCSDKAQCDLYWQRAQAWIAQNSQWRIRAATDTVIETFGPGRMNGMALAYQLTKIPEAGGGAEIVVRAGCVNMFGCDAEPWQAIAVLKEYIKGRTG